MAIRYPKEVHEFIQANYYGRRPEELAELVNQRFSSGYTPAQMKSYVNNRKLPNDIPRKQIYSDVFPKEVVEYINKNYLGVGPKEMTARLNKIFGKEYTRSQLKGFYRNHNLNSGLTGQFEKGHIPTNPFKPGQFPAGSIKHRFKKGHKPINWRPVGSERVNVDGYIEIKTEEPNVWKLKQKVVWEAVNGPVPDGFKLIFLDGNKENVNIDNLEMISNDEMLEMNRNKLRYDDPESTKTGILIAKVNRTAAKLQKQSKQENKNERKPG